MNEQQKRLVEIVNDVLQWNLEMLDFWKRVGAVEKMADISEVEKQELRKTAIEVGELFTKVTELSDSQPSAQELIDQLIASHDRLCEQLAEANSRLDCILANRKPNPD